MMPEGKIISDANCFCYVSLGVSWKKIRISEAYIIQSWSSLVCVFRQECALPPWPAPDPSERLALPDTDLLRFPAAFPPKPRQQSSLTAAIIAHLRVPAHLPSTQRKKPKLLHQAIHSFSPVPPSSPIEKVGFFFLTEVSVHIAVPVSTAQHNTSFTHKRTDVCSHTLFHRKWLQTLNIVPCAVLYEPVYLFKVGFFISRVWCHEISFLLFTYFFMTFSEAFSQQLFFSPHCGHFKS